MSRRSERNSNAHGPRRRRIPEAAIAILLALLLALFLLGRIRGSFSSPAPAHIKPASLYPRAFLAREMEI